MLSFGQDVKPVVVTEDPKAFLVCVLIRPPVSCEIVAGRFAKEKNDGLQQYRSVLTSSYVFDISTESAVAHLSWGVALLHDFFNCVQQAIKHRPDVCVQMSIHPVFHYLGLVACNKLCDCL